MARTETVTALFTDLVGSTELAAALGHDAYEHLRQEHFAALRAAIAAHHGVEVKTTGDGLMVMFASAADALNGAVAMQQAAELHARRLPSHQLAIRVGASSGEASRVENDWYGTPVVEAARLCATAAPGQIVVSEVVRLMARGRGYTLTPLGALELKGLEEPVPAYAVAWEPLAAPPTAAPIPLPSLLFGGPQFRFAGRGAELETITAIWRDTLAAHSHTVFLAGEPGIGKTRLAAETARLAHAAGATVLCGRCDEDLGVPFQPFVEALAYFIEHTPVEHLGDQLGPYAGELVRLIPELGVKLPNLPAPLRSDPETERYRLFDSIARWLASASAVRPLVLVLDDLHWAAKPTLLLLRHVVRAAAAAPLLIVGTHRDTDIDSNHPLTALLADLRRVPGVERLSLSGLDETAVEALVESIAGRTTDAVGSSLTRALSEETDGNPFFVGEIVRHWVESGAMRQRVGQLVSAEGVSEVGIPDSIRDVVGRRLDRLPGDASKILTLAAVVGRDFDLGTLTALTDDRDDAVLAAIEAAIAAGLVEEIGVDAYRFAHSLVRTTLYEALSDTRRVRLHHRVAEAIAARRPNDVTALANHYSHAATGGDLRKAVDYCAKAGDDALAKLAYDQAVVFYRHALTLLAKDPDRDATEYRELLL
ncbi:MAG TPA: AAA family ATPase, partial [Candidatus Kryptonia bacterium]|nr:AAA family ATPase [Candidatus Kryptonia bacterium]